jgi:hypothetical protein
MEIEESLVYPQLAQVVGEEPDEEAHTEHDLARTGLEQLRELQGAPGFGAAVAMLRGGIQHHVHEEEHELLPELKSGLDRESYRQLCDDVAAAKEQAGQAPAGASRSARATKSASRRSPSPSSGSTAKRASGSRKQAGTRKQASGSRKQAASRSTRGRS